MQSMEAELETLRPETQAAKERCETLQAEAQTAHDQAAAAQEHTTAAELKARADMKVGQALTKSTLTVQSADQDSNSASDP